VIMDWKHSHQDGSRAVPPVPTTPAAMQALLHERRREERERPDRRREGMLAALQARDNLRRRLGAEDGG
jgi:hypothetical protein